MTLSLHTDRRTGLRQEWIDNWQLTQALRQSLEDQTAELPELLEQIKASGPSGRPRWAEMATDQWATPTGFTSWEDYVDAALETDLDTLSAAVAALETSEQTESPLRSLDIPEMEIAALGTPEALLMLDRISAGDISPADALRELRSRKENSLVERKLQLTPALAAQLGALGPDLDAVIQVALRAGLAALGRRRSTTAEMSSPLESGNGSDGSDGSDGSSRARACGKQKRQQRIPVDQLSVGSLVSGAQAADLLGTFRQAPTNLVKETREKGQALAVLKGRGWEFTRRIDDACTAWKVVKLPSTHPHACAFGTPPPAAAIGA